MTRSSFIRGLLLLAFGLTLVIVGAISLLYLQPRKQPVVKESEPVLATESDELPIEEPVRALAQRAHAPAAPVEPDVACRGGQLAICFALARAELESADVDAEKAREYLVLACPSREGIAQACFELAKLTDLGQGGRQSARDAAMLYDWACMGGLTDACHQAGVGHREGRIGEGSSALAVSRFEAACGADVEESCLAAGLLMKSGGPNLKPAPLSARRLFREACRLGSGAGCFEHGMSLEQSLGDDADFAAARTAYSRAIELGDRRGNRRLSWLYWNGLGGEKSRATARKYGQRGCSDGDSIACRGPELQGSL